MRKKILRVYGISKLTLLGFAALVFTDLDYLSNQIDAGLAVADLRRSILEMRRDEKNLFLYQDTSGLIHFKQEAEIAKSLLDEQRNNFVRIAGEEAINTLERQLIDFENAVMAYTALPTSQQAVAQERIRNQGHQLYEMTRDLLRSERTHLTEINDKTRDLLLFAMIVVILLELLGGMYLFRSVVNPLRELERGLKNIEEGKRQELPLPTRDREISAFVAAFNRMFKHLRAQQAQTRRNEKAAALGVLVSGVAHELNNPLSNISTSTELLIEEGCEATPETRNIWLNQIDTETERARRIVRRLLDTVRQPRNNLPSIAIDELANSVLVLLNQQIPEQVVIQLNIDPLLTAPLDRERMQQVFINLITNAIDAQAHKITITARQEQWSWDRVRDRITAGDTAIVSQSAQTLLIEVIDDGQGIPETLRNHLFDPFVTTKPSGEGTGLGLYLVEEIIAEHQGCIVVESDHSQGTRFFIWLPITEQQP
jgi:two-component system, NtrC family, sensor kinase